MDIVTAAEFDRLFDTFDRSAVRLETRDRYHVADEVEPLRQFLAGQAPDLGWFEPWIGRVSAAVAAGRRYQRVRVVPDPLTDYLRFEAWLCRANVEAGEDIGYLDRARADELALPAYDYWLFDDHILAMMHFDDDDTPQGAAIITDTATVTQHRRWLQVAIQAATPYDRFATTIQAAGSG